MPLNLDSETIQNTVISKKFNVDLQEGELLSLTIGSESVSRNVPNGKRALGNIIVNISVLDR